MPSPDNISARLLAFPLFSGMTPDDIVEIAGYTRLEFRKALAGEVIAEEGKPSDYVVFLLSGTMTLTKHSEDRGYTIVEHLDAPYSFQISTVFGRHQFFLATYTALTPCSYFILEKKYVMKIARLSMVFRLNMLGLIATESQQMYEARWQRPALSEREAFAKFVADHCRQPEGRKQLKITKVRLGQELGYTRIRVSIVLSELEAEGLISVTRKIITIPSLERLAKACWPRE